MQFLNLQAIPGDIADLGGTKTARWLKKDSRKLEESFVDILLLQTIYFIQKQRQTQEKYEENPKKTLGLTMSQALPQYKQQTSLAMS